MSEENQEKREVKSGFPRFIPVPWNIQELTTKPMDVWVYIALSHYADWKTGECFPTYETITQKFGISKPSFSKSIKNLEKLGLIKTEKKHRNTTTYYVFPDTVRVKNIDTEVKNFNHLSKNNLPNRVKNFNSNIHSLNLNSINVEIQDNDFTEERFQYIWDQYGRNRPKADKKNAETQIRKAIKKYGYERIKEKIDAICAVYDFWPQQEKQFIPMATTFFRAERFMDDLETFTQRLPPEIKIKALDSARNGSKQASTNNVEVNPDKMVEKVLILALTEGDFQSIDLGDQHLHYAIKMKGGWTNIIETVKTDTQLKPTLLGIYKMAKEKNLRAAMILGTGEPRPKKITIRE